MKLTPIFTNICLTQGDVNDFEWGILGIKVNKLRIKRNGSKNLNYNNFSLWIGLDSFFIKPDVSSAKDVGQGEPVCPTYLLAQI